MSDDKTEQPSPHKLQEARKKGQVAKSNDVVAAFSLLVIFILFSMTGKNILTALAGTIRQQIQQLGSFQISIENFPAFAMSLATSFLLIVAPVFAAAIVAGIVGNLLQSGFLYSLDSLSPKMERINPLEGIKKVFSSKGFIETAKVLLRILIMIVVFQNFFRKHLPLMLSTGRMYLDDMFSVFGSMAMDLFYSMTILLVVMGGLDYILQRYLFMKDMMMTKQEVKEEYKQQEGDPFLKQRLRQRARELVKARMLDGVKTSRLVVTNPTHYACALKYNEEEDEAPILVAKGKDHLAATIKKLAKEHDIPIVENKPLAQALYKQVDVDQIIPPDMYQAVAEVIAFIERLDSEKVAGLKQQQQYRQTHQGQINPTFDEGELPW